MDLHTRLNQGLFLSALHEYTFGPYCAARSLGCAMVQTGLYFAEPEASEAVRQKYPATFLPEDMEVCSAFLTEDCQQARSGSPAAVCMNLGALSLEPGLRAAQCLIEAGGDLVELNIHGGFIRYMEAGRMRAMLYPENQPELLRWIAAYTKHDIPLIVKFSARDHRPELLKLLGELAHYDLFGVHINIRSEAHKKPDLTLLEQVRSAYPGFLLVSGYVRSPAEVRDCFGRGANMVGIGEPTLQDPGFIGRLAQAAG